ncbi:MAG: hypothetical protein AB3X44_10980 [Leptothrix sp. (in: b-proteobacteria)]
MEQTFIAVVHRRFSDYVTSDFQEIAHHIETSAPDSPLKRFVIAQLCGIISQDELSEITGVTATEIQAFNDKLVHGFKLETRKYDRECLRHNLCLSFWRLQNRLRRAFKHM